MHRSNTSRRGSVVRTALQSDRWKREPRENDVRCTGFDNRQSIPISYCGLLGEAPDRPLGRLTKSFDQFSKFGCRSHLSGISSDCYHISSPDPSGIGARLSMQRAISDANISPDDVSYVNAHATSTPTGDTIELRAIREVFGNRKITVSSIKGEGTKDALHSRESADGSLFQVT